MITILIRTDELVYIRNSYAMRTSLKYTRTQCRNYNKTILVGLASFHSMTEMIKLTRLIYVSPMSMNV